MGHVSYPLLAEQCAPPPSTRPPHQCDRSHMSSTLLTGRLGSWYSTDVLECLYDVASAHRGPAAAFQAKATLRGGTPSPPLV